MCYYCWVNVTTSVGTRCVAVMNHPDLRHGVHISTKPSTRSHFLVTSSSKCLPALVFQTMTPASVYMETRHRSNESSTSSEVKVLVWMMMLISNVGYLLVCEIGGSHLALVHVWGSNPYSSTNCCHMRGITTGCTYHGCGGTP